MLDKSGNLCYRSHASKCQKCLMYIKDYKCFVYDYIQYRIWENIIGYECEYFDSILKDQLNSHYIFPDFEDRDRFPEKKFSGTYHFNSKGEIIGKL